MRKALAILVAFFSTYCFGGENMYDQELSKHAATLRSLMIQAQKTSPKDVARSLALREELFELSKSLHRLEEEVGATNVELMKKGAQSDRVLLLVAGSSKAIDLAQALTSSYLETREKAFWTAATSAAESARTLMAAQ